MEHLNKPQRFPIRKINSVLQIMTNIKGYLAYPMASFLAYEYRRFLRQTQHSAQLDPTKQMPYTTMGRSSHCMHGARQEQTYQLSGEAV